MQRRNNKQPASSAGFKSIEPTDETTQPQVAVMPAQATQDRATDSLNRLTRLPRLFTIAQVAEYLGVSQRTVRRMVKTRVLPVVRIGRSMRVSESALARLVTS